MTNVIGSVVMFGLLMSVTGCTVTLTGTNYIGDGLVVATASCNPGEQVFARAYLVRNSHPKDSGRQMVCNNTHGQNAQLLYVWPYDEIVVEFEANAQYPSAWIRVSNGSIQPLRAPS